MKTDNLIAALAADTRHEPPLERQAIWMLPAFGLSALGILLILGLRPDAHIVMLHPLVAVKSLVPLGVGLVAAVAALRLLRPGQGVGALRRLFWLLPLPAVLAVAFTLASQPVEAWPVLLQGQSIAFCLAIIPLTSMLPMGVGLWLAQRGAPTRPALAGAVVGLAAAGISAAIYSLYCTEDSPLFYTVWYGTAIMAVTGLGALLGHRLLRW